MFDDVLDFSVYRENDKRFISERLVSFLFVFWSVWGILSVTAGFYEIYYYTFEWRPEQSQFVLGWTSPAPFYYAVEKFVITFFCFKIAFNVIKAEEVEDIIFVFIGVYIIFISSRVVDWYDAYYPFIPLFFVLFFRQVWLCFIFYIVSLVVFMFSFKPEALSNFAPFYVAYSVLDLASLLLVLISMVVFKFKIEYLAFHKLKRGYRFMILIGFIPIISSLFLDYYSIWRFIR